MLIDALVDYGNPPEWASGWGSDKFGVFLEFSVGDVEQRMRFIPPGSFMMGSPKDEPGGYEDEGPQHEVILESGFWLFDTPVTQELYQEVMGENPSRFLSKHRPVERVDIDMAESFIGSLNERIPGLLLSLPSEACWEYACRSGSETTLYSGPMEIHGDANAPALDPIAWYAGNSGKEFDLEVGVDINVLYSDFQYKSDQAGTRSVKGKQPNAWGLYDMLGNVWEWTEDHWHDSYDGAPGDGSAWRREDKEAPRVVRGGAWSGEARYVRSAMRFLVAPDDRRFLGFRCARVQA